MFDQVNYLTIH